jgi:hypothetical protein
MKEVFNPIRAQRGEFRVALNLTELGEQAWDVLSRSQQLGFAQPQFASHKNTVWAIILQQFHRYDADPSTVVDPWDQQLYELWQTVGENETDKLVILHNFAAYFEVA